MLFYVLLLLPLGNYLDQWASLNLFFAAGEKESYVNSVHKQAFLDPNILCFCTMSTQWLVSKQVMIRTMCCLSVVYQQLTLWHKSLQVTTVNVPICKLLEIIVDIK